MHNCTQRAEDTAALKILKLSQATSEKWIQWKCQKYLLHIHCKQQTTVDYNNYKIINKFCNTVTVRISPRDDPEVIRRTRQHSILLNFQPKCRELHSLGCPRAGRQNSVWNDCRNRQFDQQVVINTWLYCMSIQSYVRHNVQPS